ncbi:lectin subunit alpha [Prochlorococcus marinus]|uniref:lectin subunit alpha n=1 Tax=Prochlorococcus marinus TaxID=1219 RepID=UPI001AD9BDBF|nr:lectin subunit alpha [Prochlorococcus marinus]MBO8204626.1 lectin subunit alpha [Prochlorococcus marinus CUG1415]MBW3043917.1 lectin subunit alpha [Prochlorococcus marinus str. MU1415]
MDPLDPLTEIIKSGQAFSPSVALEKIFWAIIGIFFLVAILKSITNSLRSQILFFRKSLFSFSKDKKNKEDSFSQSYGNEK